MWSVSDRTIHCGFQFVHLVTPGGRGDLKKESPMQSFLVPMVHLNDLMALSITSGECLSIGLVWSSDCMTKKRSEAKDPSVSSGPTSI